MHVPLRPEREFQLDVADVEAALSQRTRAIVLTTPHNPTGACVPAETLAALGEICREHDLWLVADEVYGSLLFGGRSTRACSPSTAPRSASRASRASRSRTR